MSTTTSAQPLSDPTPIAPDGPVGRVVAVSMATGAVGAGTAVFGILPGASEAAVTGGALIGSAAGWAALAWATALFPARPQRWAYVPATVMAAAGTALLALA